SLSFFLYRHAPPRDLHSFPTRRSSDLVPDGPRGAWMACLLGHLAVRGDLTGPESRDDRSYPVLEGGHARRKSPGPPFRDGLTSRSEEHTSELQSRFDLVCRLLLEKKKK